ncbi:MAG TPA: NAD-dependent epimerase/dehydratase family protein, partial [Solirubrobacterales bacterium]|nr:NAD-dependent epimerase/dehydratase family protein [Solirubrobacterales bacterium]
MKILLSGASGFLGSRLIPHLRDAGHETVQLVRREPADAGQRRWNPAAGVIDRAIVDDVDAVINLTGANVGSHRWTAAYKRLLIESRVDATTTLARAVAASEKTRTFISSSGVDFYGDTGD